MRNRPGKSMWQDMDTFERIYLIASLAMILGITMAPVILFGR